MDSRVSRRSFIVAAMLAAGGLTLGCRPATAGAVAETEIGPWLTIGADGRITVRVTTPEIGNGVATNAAMLVAEELGCDWSMVAVEYASPSRDLAEHAYSAAGGSVAWFSGRSTLPDRMKMMLQVGASARERLRLAAARRWAVPDAEVTIDKGRLVHSPSHRSLGFGEVASDAAAIRLTVEPQLKPESAWTLIGRASPKRLELPAIVAGRAVYGVDVQVPGMVYAALRQSPVQGGRLRHLDATRARAMPGVIDVIVVDPSEPRGDPSNGPEPMNFPAFTSAAQSAVAVIAEHYWQAHQALEALTTEWQDGPGAEWIDSAQFEAKARDLTLATTAKPLLAKGSVEGHTGKLVEALYTTPYCDHAPIEPLNGVARVTTDGVEVWLATQNIQQSAWVAADEARVPLAKVVFHQTLVGGAFGRRTLADDTKMIVAVARKVPGRAVKLIWTRDEMMRQGRYRPYAAARIDGRLDPAGMPASLTARVAQARGFPPLGLIDSPYLGVGVPNVRVDQHLLDMHLLTGSFRGPSYNSYAFMLESFIDECAVAAGSDPLAYRLKLLSNWSDAGWAACLNVVAARSGFGKSLPRGRGQGIAIANWGGYGRPRRGTTAAAVAEVEVSRKGELKVVQIDLAFDCGRMLNEDVVRQQLTGATLFGLNVALNEELTLARGRIVEGNFDTYPILRGGEVPPIVIHLDALSGDDRYGEIGEVGVGPVGAAVANAVFRATGKRMRSQPFRRHDLSWA